jgi:hypothetical protein
MAKKPALAPTNQHDEVIEIPVTFGGKALTSDRDQKQKVRRLFLQMRKEKRR